MMTIDRLTRDAAADRGVKSISIGEDPCIPGMEPRARGPLAVLCSRRFGCNLEFYRRHARSHTPPPWRSVPGARRAVVRTDRPCASPGGCNARARRGVPRTAAGCAPLLSPGGDLEWDPDRGPGREGRRRGAAACGCRALRRRLLAAIDTPGHGGERPVSTAEGAGAWLARPGCPRRLDPGQPRPGSDRLRDENEPRPALRRARAAGRHPERALPPFRPADRDVIKSPPQTPGFSYGVRRSPRVIKRVSIIVNVRCDRTGLWYDAVSSLATC